MPHVEAQPLHVFVYGTLRAGGSNDIRRYTPTPAFVGYASMSGVLYDLGPYPGLVLSGGAAVRGEVYRIAPEVEAQLDRLESIAQDDSGEYIRRQCDVVVDDRTLRCLVYEIHPSRIVGRPVIPGGDWFARAVSAKES